MTVTEDSIREEVERLRSKLWPDGKSMDKNISQNERKTLYKEFFLKRSTIHGIEADKEMERGGNSFSISFIIGEGEYKGDYSATVVFKKDTPSALVKETMGHLMESAKRTYFPKVYGEDSCGNKVKKYIDDFGQESWDLIESDNGGTRED